MAEGTRNAQPIKEKEVEMGKGSCRPGAGKRGTLSPRAHYCRNKAWVAGTEKPIRDSSILSTRALHNECCPHRE